MVAQTGCDAVMIGRMAPSNPWIFRQIEEYTSGSGNGYAGSSLQPGQAPGLAAGSDESGELALARMDEDARVSISKLYREPSEADRYQMIRTYFQMLIEEEMPGAEGKMKQFASWFTHGVAGGAALRKAIYESKSRVEILSSVEQFFENRLEGCGRGRSAPELLTSIS
jgi:tRNA-dihydrouridine synthase